MKKLLSLYFFPIKKLLERSEIENVYDIAYAIKFFSFVSVLITVLAVLIDSYYFGSEITFLKSLLCFTVIHFSTPHVCFISRELFTNEWFHSPFRAISRILSKEWTEK